MQIPISEIYVPQRIRGVDEDAVEEMKVSIEQYGLLSPITIARADGLKPPLKYTLVCGAHRLSAWTQLFDAGSVSPCIEAHILPQTNAPTQLAFVELEENIRRKNLAWYELCLGVGKLYFDLLKADPVFPAKRLSEMLQQNQRLTSHQLQLYDARNEYPHVMLEDTINRAIERLRLAQVAELAKEKLRRQREKRTKEDTEYNAWNQAGIKEPESSDDPLRACPAGSFAPIFPSALDLLQALDDNSVDLCATDPPFFITIQNGRHRRSLGEGAIYSPEQKDKPEDMYKILAPCIPHLARVLKPGCHIYMFFPIERLAEFRRLFESVGFLVNTVPLIWVRQGVGAAANQPYYLPGSQYQAILMAFAPGERRRLQKQGQSNVLLYDAIPPQHKTHPLEIPMFVYSDLIARSACPGDTMIDPFCGTGNSIVAGIKSYCKVLAAELREDYRNLATLKAQEAEAWLRDAGGTPEMEVPDA